LKPRQIAEEPLLAGTHSVCELNPRLSTSKYIDRVVPLSHPLDCFAPGADADWDKGDNSSMGCEPQNHHPLRERVLLPDEGLQTQEALAQELLCQALPSVQTEELKVPQTEEVPQILPKESCTVLLETDRSELKMYHNRKIQAYLDSCVKEVKSLLLLNPPIKVYGKPAVQHRSIGFFSDDSIGYAYSGQLMGSQKLGPSLKALLLAVNAFLKADFNGILVNKYANGEDYIGQHSDDEKALGNVGVLTISYGAQRTFHITNKLTNETVGDFLLTHGSMYLMSGDFQKQFKHGIKKDAKVVHPRISFTFRKHLK
jgi:alkylated DNA repair dioxygenase AlkB